MRIVDSFPHRVREIESVWIPMSDGVQLSARVWMPEGAEEAPVPALIEYLPYRKRDRMRERDQGMHHWFAGNGYASVRIDLRGCGESEGLLADEYTELEQRDGMEAIAWTASQKWCSGSVGMFGKSWGGFNSLQIAARRPPALKAIITVCASDDRYGDDAHYMGGCLLNESLTWGSMLQALGAHPPDPAIVGDQWRELWMARMKAAPLFPEIWLRHQHRDDYWKQGSISESYGAIECAVYAIGGWADAYSNAVPRLLQHLSCPKKGLIGPWAHAYPHQAVPQPIGFLQESLRWWDRWLKGAANGIMEEPLLRAWMAGRWIAEEAWPPARIEPRVFEIDRGGITRSPQTVGLGAERWCPFEPEVGLDQREEDGKSLAFDLDPVQERIEILGAPVVTLELAIDRPVGFVCVRLLDVSPEGASQRVSYALANLCHRDGSEHPSPLVPHQRHRIEVRLNDVAYAFAAGHRLRVAISSAYWPVAWPSPEPVTLSLHSVALSLPVRPPREEDAALPPFAEAEAAPGPTVIDLDPDRSVRIIERDLCSGITTVTSIVDAGDDGRPAMMRIEDVDLEYGHGTIERFRIRDEDPLSAEAEVRHHLRVVRGEWQVEARVRLRMTCTVDRFRLEGALEAFEGERCVLVRRWDQAVPRSLV